MQKVFTQLTLAEWLRHLFDHPVAKPAWYWDPDADSAGLEPQCVIAHAAELFSLSVELLSPYDDAQANQGLWFLIGEGTTPLYTLSDASIPLELRLRCIRSIATIFGQYFLPRCTPHLSHLDEKGAGPLNPVCYMWWDIFPLSGAPGEAARREIDDACLSVMDSVLQLPSVACQESALHGLGHWALYYEDRCRQIISAYIGRHRDLSPGLRQYAARALLGDVL